MYFIFGYRYLIAGSVAIVSDAVHDLGDAVREALREHGIGYVTMEFETTGKHCHIQAPCAHRYHHHQKHKTPARPKQIVQAF